MAGFAVACLPSSPEMGSRVSACPSEPWDPSSAEYGSRAISSFIGNETVRGVSCPKVPRAGALLCESGFRLESLRLAQIVLIRPAVSCNRVLGRSLLKQARYFEANRACEGVGAEALNHRIPMDRLRDRVVSLI